MRRDSAGGMECILCERKFDLADVKILRFFPSTGVCFDCYHRGTKNKRAAWCFGKGSITGLGGQVLEYGYNPKARECQSECPDRKFCPLFLTGQIYVWRDAMVKVRDVPVADEYVPKKVKNNYKGPRLPFRSTGAMTTQAFMICMKGVMIDDLVKWVKTQGGSSRRILRIMRSGCFNGKRWKVNEANGYLKIIYEGHDA
jgi:hypothetical protein